MFTGNGQTDPTDPTAAPTDPPLPTAAPTTPGD